MACIEIKIKDGIYKITNGSENQSGRVERSDWNLVYDFITTGKLPEGYKVIGTDNNGEALDRDVLFDYLTNELVQAKEKNTLSINSIPDNISREDFINKTIGNKELNKALYEDYDTDLFVNNAVIRHDWGDTKNWYGFTDKRALLVSGNNFYYNDHKVKTLYTAYIALKNGNVRIKTIIEKLYNKLNHADKTNVFSKMTWLANNQIKELVAALYTPYNARVNITEEELQEDLKENVAKFKGKTFTYKQNDYIIINNDQVNSIWALNLQSGKEESVSKSRISKIFTTYSLEYKDAIYQLVNKTWYKNENNKLIKLDINNYNDKELVDTLYTQWFGFVNDAFQRIDFSEGRKQDKNFNEKLEYQSINGNAKIGDLTLVDILPENTVIKTASGIYVKHGETFSNGLEELSNTEKILYIEIPKSENNKLYEEILSLKETTTTDPVLSESDLRIILYEGFNIENFDNVWFNFNSDELIRIAAKTIDNKIVPYIQIGTKNDIYLNEDTNYYIKLAISYYNTLNNPNIEKPSSCNNYAKFWRMLKDIKINNEDRLVDDNTKKYIDTIVENMDKEIDFAEILKSNKENVLTNNYRNKANKKKIDAFIEELINKGLYITSCEI